MKTWREWKEKCKFAIVDKNGRQTCTRKGRSSVSCKGKDRYCNVIPKAIAEKFKLHKHMDFAAYVKGLPREEQWAARTERDRLEINHWKNEYAEFRGAICMALNGGFLLKELVIAALKKHQAPGGQYE